LLVYLYAMTYKVGLLKFLFRETHMNTKLTKVTKLLSLITISSFLLAGQVGYCTGFEESIEAYSHNRPSDPSFGGNFFSLKPQKREYDSALEREVVVQSIGTKWNQAAFNGPVHTPVTIGKVEDHSSFGKWGVPRSLHLPIKLPGTEIRIPSEYVHFTQVIQDILDFEVTHNKDMKDYFAYLTVDQAFVPKANYQRVPGPHVDGLPRDKDNPESQPIDHSYLVTDAIPTMFYPQPFDMTPYDLKRHHFFDIFRARSDESRTITVNPLDINLMDAYSVHTPLETHVDVRRTFIRLEFSVLEFDREGNSVNPFFTSENSGYAYPFVYRPRPISDDLFIPRGIFSDKPVHNKEFLEEPLDEFGREKLSAVYKANSRVLSKNSGYRDLDAIVSQIEDRAMEGLVITKQSKALSFLLYTRDQYGVYLHTFFTLSGGMGQEALIYGLTALKQICDEHALKIGREKGEIPITFVLNSNNEEMLPYMSRAARLGKIAFKIVPLSDRLGDLERTHDDQLLFEQLTCDTRRHKRYLESIALGERGKSIDIKWFEADKSNLDMLSLESFRKRAPIPKEVIEFNINSKNTLITTDPHSDGNKQEDIARILDIRLYPALREMILKSKVEIFLGSKQEMWAYYQSKGTQVVMEFVIPSSASYYAARTKDGSYFVIMAALVSRENLIAQLLTLKLAGVEMDSLDIVGEVEHFDFLMAADFEQLNQKLPELKLGSHVLIVAGCGLEHMVSEIIQSKFEGRILKVETFVGNIVSLVYSQFDRPINGLNGIITLNLNYGEISGKIVRNILEHYSSKYLFSGGAAGYISSEGGMDKPEIGNRISISTSMNEDLERVVLSKAELVFEQEDASQATHLQIPSIFLETYDWLHEAKKRGSSVDVETFHILRAIKDYNSSHPHELVKVDCGCFVSDYVGEVPLREYSSVFRRYPEYLNRFLDAILTVDQKSDGIVGRH